MSGYGGIVYLRAVYEDASTTISLVTSKTRVAPLKTLSVPKLELCGALLTARLLLSTSQDIDLLPTVIFVWSDSEEVLGWLAKSSSCWKTFVANRVAEIQDLVPTPQWRHVPTDSNPADHASRGLTPKELVCEDLWWNGPTWLRLPLNHWPSPMLHSLVLPESRQVVMASLRLIQPRCGRHSPASTSSSELSPGARDSTTDAANKRKSEAPLHSVSPRKK